MRPLTWLPPLLCGTVLVAGGYAGLAGLAQTRWVPFTLGLLALVLLDALGPRLPAPAVLAGQAALVALVAFADGSGMARVLFLLLPFAAYFALGRAVAIAVGIASGLFLVTAFQLTVPHWTRSVEHVSDLLMFGIGLILALAMAELSAAAERNRLARDVHDGIGHHLTAVSVLLEKATAFRDHDPATADRAIEDARESARRALADVRTSVRALREPFRLGDELTRLVHHLDVAVSCAGDESRYPTATLLTLYRAAQEGITNAMRHAPGSTVTVTVHCGPREARLVVADDGPGFAAHREGFGLRNLRERVARAGGSVEVASGGGTRLTVTLPRSAT